MLIPSRGPHPSFRSAEGSPEVGRDPGTQPACRRCRGTRAAWCSYHQATLTTPIDRRLAGGRSGPNWKEDPHRDLGCGVGPVTGAAGSDGQCGRGGRHRFRLKAEGLLMLIPSRGPHPFCCFCLTVPVPAGPGQVAARDAAHCSRARHAADARAVRTRAPLRAEVADVRQALALAAWARTARIGADGGRARGHHGALRRRRRPRRPARSCWPGGPRTTPRPTTGPLVEVPVTYDGADLADVADALGHRRRRAWPPGSRGPSWSRRSAASRRGSPTSAACPPSWPCRGWTRPGPRCRRGPSRSPTAGAGSTRPPRRAAGGCSAAPTASCGTPRSDSPALLAPGTRVRLVPA